MTGKDFMKREIPLFIFDLNRSHNLGECDFVTCTDRDNGFIAKIDYLEDAQDAVTDTTRIVKGRNGISPRMEIKRIIGINPINSSIRTLMKKGMDLYVERTQKSINVNSPSTEQCIDFLNVLIKGNRHIISEHGVNYKERETILTSLAMLEHIKAKLEKM